MLSASLPPGVPGLQVVHRLGGLLEGVAVLDRDAQRAVVEQRREALEVLRRRLRHQVEPARPLPRRRARLEDERSSTSLVRGGGEHGSARGIAHDNRT
jgi:hypothetical protein